MNVSPTPTPVGNFTFNTHITYAQSEDDDGSFEGSLIAFIVIFSIFMVALIVLGIVLVRRYQQKRRVKRPVVAPPVPFTPPPVPMAVYPNAAPAVPYQGEAPRVSLPPVRVMEGHANMPMPNMGMNMNMNMGRNMGPGGEGAGIGAENSVQSGSSTPVEV